jgi:spermidine synthase
MASMVEPLIDFDTFIYNEMMAHPVLFTHPKACKIALIHCQNNGLVQEILKHPQITHLSIINPPANLDQTHSDPRITWLQSNYREWLDLAQPESYDIILLPDTSSLPAFTQTIYQQYRAILTKDGILVCQSDSLFQLDRLKSTYEAMHQAGFEDLQVMHFPQPSALHGARAAILAIKKGTFKRVREKDIFNKPFGTRYYNFDVHNAALVMPEFMREELAIET